MCAEPGLKQNERNKTNGSATRNFSSGLSQSEQGNSHLEPMSIACRQSSILVISTGHWIDAIANNGADAYMMTITWKHKKTLQNAEALHKKNFSSSSLHSLINIHYRQSELIFIVSRMKQFNEAKRNTWKKIFMKLKKKIKKQGICKKVISHRISDKWR